MIKQTENGVLLEVKVKPNSKKFGFVRKGGKLILEVTSPPKEGKANAEIIRGLKRVLGKDVEIFKGLKSREKIIFVNGAASEDIKNRTGLS